VPIDSKGKKIILFFEGAMSEPQVYLNGKKLENGHMVIVIFFLMFPNLYKKERTLSVNYLINLLPLVSWCWFISKSKHYCKNNKHRPMGTVCNDTFISEEVAKVNIKTKLLEKIVV
jgi:beta-galactosidase